MSLGLVEPFFPQLGSVVHEGPESAFTAPGGSLGSGGPRYWSPSALCRKVTAPVKNVRKSLRRVWPGCVRVPSMFLDVDGELVSLEASTRSCLATRLADEAIDWELTSLLGDELDVVVVPPDELVPLRSMLGRWHADDGVLREDLRRLQDALAAALCRRAIVTA